MGAVERLQAATDRDAIGAAEERDPQAVAVALADARQHEVAAVLEFFLVGDRLHALGKLARQRGKVERLVDEVLAQPARQRVALLVLLEAAEALGAAALVLRAQALGQAQRRGVERARRLAQHQARGRAGLAHQGVDDQVGDDVFDGAHGADSGREAGARFCHVHGGVASPIRHHEWVLCRSAGRREQGRDAFGGGAAGRELFHGRRGRLAARMNHVHYARFGQGRFSWKRRVPSCAG